MNDFTASNGITVASETQGITGDRRIHVGDTTVQLSSAQTIALIEALDHERDEDLGRWRWPENPTYVVYPTTVRTRVRVMRETGVGELEWVDKGDARPYEFCHAARAYFAAHPESKPWHDAKEGEVWELTFRAGAHAWFVNGDYFQSTKTLTNIRKDDAHIVSGRRIYPEVS